MPRQAFPLLNMPAFTGHTTGRADFPHRRERKCPAGKSCRRVDRSGSQAPPSPYNTAFSESSGSYRALQDSSSIALPWLIVKSAPEVRGLGCAGIIRPRCYYAPVRLPLGPPSCRWRRGASLAFMGLARLPASPFQRAVPLPRRTKWERPSIASPFTRPSPAIRRGGVRISTFEACSDFTHITAR